MNGGETYLYCVYPDFGKKPTLEGLRNFLTTHGVNFSSWGRKGTKSLSQLLEEISNGEARLNMRYRNGQREVIRLIRPVAIDVYYTSPDGERYRLVENQVTFRDESVVSRNLPRSLSDKMKGNETPEDAARRAIREELPQIRNYKLQRIDENRYPLERRAYIYPGLITRSHATSFSIEIGPESYNPFGYTTVEEECTTIFRWVREARP